ncbi:hypothetical protein [Actinokineospora bangkokensis]|uniref:Uncharacterized protein n=1 Tax=Actinokineospora bangkokensis TaxID=1193682 RepID=A0A1Q9LJN2_9PSEU|nr:hypothetical protein [Actinokineospora bangkokensis]OLR92189.1 hypothetical protein BJP25_22940 [Actinokineospora bangkokensis]
MSYTNRYNDPVRGGSNNPYHFDGADSTDGGASRSTRHRGLPVSMDTESLRRLAQGYTDASEGVYEIYRRVNLMDGTYAEAFGDDSAGKKMLASYTKLKTGVAKGVQNLARGVQATGEGLEFQAKIADRVEENNTRIAKQLAPQEGSGDGTGTGEHAEATPRRYARLARMGGARLRADQPGEESPQDGQRVAKRVVEQPKEGTLHSRVRADSPQEFTEDGLPLARRMDTVSALPRLRADAPQEFTEDGLPLARRMDTVSALPRLRADAPQEFTEDGLPLARRMEPLQPLEPSRGLEPVAEAQLLPALPGIDPIQSALEPALPGIPATQFIDTPAGQREVLPFPADPAAERDTFVGMLRAQLRPGQQVVVQQGEQPDGTYLASPAMIRQPGVDGGPGVEGWVLPVDDARLRVSLLMGGLERTLAPGETVVVTG